MSSPSKSPSPQAPDAATSVDVPFWRAKTLGAMTAEEWESLCDGCGRCCLVKLEDEDSGAVAYTDVACRLFDTASCRCADYANRSQVVTDCVRLTPEAVVTLSWLPPTCAYRLVADGKDLPFWHPLVSGDAASVAAAGVSVHGKVAGLETEFGLFELVDHIVNWPVRWPRGAKAARPASAGKARSSTARSSKDRRATAGPRGTAAKPAGA